VVLVVDADVVELLFAPILLVGMTFLLPKELSLKRWACSLSNVTAEQWTPICFREKRCVWSRRCDGDDERHVDRFLVYSNSKEADLYELKGDAIIIK
jgi:hypothetical protein